MYEKAIEELKNQVRMIDKKMPTIEESIKTYAQMAKNYERERDDFIAKKENYQMAIDRLEHMEDENE